jgi:hypothetical protein
MTKVDEGIEETAARPAKPRPRRRRKAAPKPAVAPPPPYRRSRWNRRPLYECASCAYSTLEEQEIDRHVRLAHGASPSDAAAAAKE